MSTSTQHEACARPGENASAPLSRVYAELAALHPDFDVHVGEPSGDGWLDASTLAEPASGPLQALLSRIAARMGSTDAKVVASSFALRFGWSAGAPIAAYVAAGMVPDLSVENVAFRFSQSCAFERVALRSMAATAMSGHAHGPHPRLREVPDAEALLRTLRSSLVDQAQPIVEALAAWARTPPSAMWGLITSSWASQLAAVCSALGEPERALALAAALFVDGEPAFALAPRLAVLEHRGVTRVYQERGSCCLYHKVSAGNYCASCPLVADAERRERNCAYIDRTLERS